MHLNTGHLLTFYIVGDSYACVNKHASVHYNCSKIYAFKLYYNCFVVLVMNYPPSVVPRPAATDCAVLMAYSGAEVTNLLAGSAQQHTTSLSLSAASHCNDFMMAIKIQEKFRQLSHLMSWQIATWVTPSSDELANSDVGYPII